MKIQGEVTVLYGDNKFHATNLLVDGAGKTICDLLTLSPSVSSVSPRMLDTSNFTIKAISFAKDSTAWQNQAHHASAVGFFAVKRIPNFVQDNSTSIPVLYNSVPSYPNPEDLVLENIDVMSSIGSNGLYLNSDWRYGGQLVNLAGLWSEIYNASSTPFERSGVSSFSLSDVSTVAMRYGCFTSGNAGNNFSGVLVASGVSPGGFQNRTYILSSSDGYNSPNVRCMDYRGFVNYIGVSSPASVNNYEQSGLVSVYNTSFSSTLEVEYKHTMNNIDVFGCLLYNGFNSMGLWTIDLNESLLSSTPPFIFNPITNPIQYRLFSKKTFNKNLVGLPNTQNSVPPFSNTIPVQNLLISWKLKFK